MRSNIAMALPRPGVEPLSECVAVGLSNVAHRNTLGDVLSDEAIEVLVATTLPGMVGGGEVAFGQELLLQHLVVVEFCSIVESNGLKTGLVLPNGSSGCLGDCWRGSRGKLLDDCEPRLSLYKGEEAVVTVTTYLGVTLPVA
jgi:hypothetical protein